MLRITGHKHLLLQVFDSGVKQSPIPAISRRSLRGGEELARDLVEEDEVIMIIMIMITKIMIMVMMMIMIDIGDEERGKERRRSGKDEETS